MTRDIVVTVDDAHLHRLGDVVEGWRSADMSIDQVLDPTGVVTGTVDDLHHHGVADVDGVLAVEDDEVERAPSRWRAAR